MTEGLMAAVTNATIPGAVFMAIGAFFIHIMLDNHQKEEYWYFLS